MSLVVGGPGSSGGTSIVDTSLKKTVKEETVIQEKKSKETIASNVNGLIKIIFNPKGLSASFFFESVDTASKSKAAVQEEGRTLATLTIIPKNTDNTITHLVELLSGGPQDEDSQLCLGYSAKRMCTIGKPIEDEKEFFAKVLPLLARGNSSAASQEVEFIRV